MRLRLLPFTISLLLVSASLFGQVAVKGEKLTPWKPGYLDLHHINTGRGSSAYFIFPDGTSLLFDAGEEDPTEPRTVSARNSVIRPDSSRRPYEWIAEYIKAASPSNHSPVIDYAILSHFHDDHMGAWYKGAPRSSKGDYILSGITGVAELIPVKTLFDRGYPAYDIPYDMKSKAYEDRLKKMPGGARYWEGFHNYLSFVKQREQDKLVTSQLKPGSAEQISMLYDARAYPGFQVRNLKSNDRIWNGKDTGTIGLFPVIRGTEAAQLPSENALSQGILINYGDFKYYTGGDIPGNVQYGQPAWMDVETPLSRSVGRVSVATMDHHGNRDAVNENMVKILRPRVWIEQSWSSDHPGQEVLIRLTTPFLYEGPRDLFTTNMLQPNRDVIGPLIDKSYKSQQGHILVRVLPGGKQYYVIILDDSQPGLIVKDLFGPYESSN